MAQRRNMGQREAPDYRALEKDVEAGIIDLFRSYGLVVVKFSQPRHTMQTEGIADLRVYRIRNGRVRTAWFEVKAKRGIQTYAQQVFQRLCEKVGEEYVIGGLFEAIELLERWSVCKLDSISPKGDPWKVRKAAIDGVPLHI